MPPDDEFDMVILEEFGGLIPAVEERARAHLIADPRLIALIYGVAP